MNLLKENPFLAGLGAATAALLLAAGYFLLDAQTRYAEETATFEQQTATLEQLQGHKPFPNEANLKAMQQERDEALAILRKIGDTVRVDAPTVTPQAFQDALRKNVSEIVERAKAEGVTLGENFFLGFEEYETRLPSAETASQLALQLASIHNVATILIDAKVREISSFHRAPLPGETGGAKKQENQAKAAGDKDLPDLRLAPFEVNFAGRPIGLPHRLQPHPRREARRVRAPRRHHQLRPGRTQEGNRGGRLRQPRQRSRPRRQQTRRRSRTPHRQPPTGLHLRRLRRGRQVIAAAAMDQIKAHYDRFLLIAAGLAVVIVAAFLALQASSLQETFVPPTVRTEGEKHSPDQGIVTLQEDHAGRWTRQRLAGQQGLALRQPHLPAR
jgi:hypothetical protein